MKQACRRRHDVRAYGGRQRARFERDGEVMRKFNGKAMTTAKTRAIMALASATSLVALATEQAEAQFSLTGSSMSQNFDTLAQSGTANAQSGGIFATTTGGWS